MNIPGSIGLMGIVVSTGLWLTVTVRHHELISARQQAFNVAIIPDAKGASPILLAAPTLPTLSWAGA